MLTAGLFHLMVDEQLGRPQTRGASSWLAATSSPVPMFAKP